jgi:hypothetical protein
MAGGVTPPVLQNPKSVLWYDGLHEVVYCHASYMPENNTPWHFLQIAFPYYELHTTCLVLI